MEDELSPASAMSIILQSKTSDEAMLCEECGFVWFLLVEVRLRSYSEEIICITSISLLCSIFCIGRRRERWSQWGGSLCPLFPPFLTPLRIIPLHRLSMVLAFGSDSSGSLRLSDRESTGNTFILNPRGLGWSSAPCLWSRLLCSQSRNCGWYIAIRLWLFADCRRNYEAGVEESPVQ